MGLESPIYVVQGFRASVGLQSPLGWGGVGKPSPRFQVSGLKYRVGKPHEIIGVGSPRV